MRLITSGTGTGRVVLIPVVATLLSGVAFQDAPAQSLERAAREVRDTQQNQINADNEAQRQRRALTRARTDARLDAETIRDPLVLPSGGPCFVLREVRITGNEPFGKSPEGHGPLIGKCVTATDIAAALNRINSYYQARGFITTRAYLPEQDVSKGIIEIAIVPGRIDGFVYGDGRQVDARVKGAFPSDRGDLLNLRDLEQGLDNYTAPRSAKATFKLIPGDKPGGSFVQVLAEDGRQWHAGLRSDNSGFKTTGIFKSTATFGLDNLVGINDQLSLGVSTTPADQRGKRFADAVSLSAAVPYGNWSFSLDAGSSRYYFVVDGVNQSYPVDGRSHHLTLSAERLLMRNANARIFAYGALKLTRTRSFIDSHEIESQRRHLTIGTLAVRGEHRVGAGTIEWDTGINFGLDAFNSYVLDKATVDPEFRMLFARLDYATPIGSTEMTYKLSVAGQYSDDVLPSSEQFSIGGWSSVRGFHDDNLYGDSGLFVSNTLEWLAYETSEFKARLNAGIDFGVLKPSAHRDWDQNHLTGVSVGADLVIRKDLSLTLKVGHALSRPSDFEARRTVAYAGLNARF